MKPSIIIADDHPISAKGMESILIQLGFEILGNHQNGLNALNDIFQKKPDYVLLDIQMPGLSGLEVAEQLKKKGVRTNVMIYTMFTELSFLKKAKALDVKGYMLKDFALEDLKKCIASIKKGKPWFHPELTDKLQATKVEFSPDLFSKLSQRERTILSSVADGKSTKTIAQDMFISERTVESHRRSIIKKLELPSKKNALLMWAIENKGFFGLVD